MLAVKLYHLNYYDERKKNNPVVKIYISYGNFEENRDESKTNMKLL